MTRVKTGKDYRGISDVEKVENKRRKQYALEKEEEARELFMMKFKPLYPELEFEDVIVIREDAVRMKGGKIYRVKEVEK